MSFKIGKNSSSGSLVDKVSDHLERVKSGIGSTYSPESSAVDLSTFLENFDTESAQMSANIEQLASVFEPGHLPGSGKFKNQQGLQAAAFLGSLSKKNILQYAEALSKEHAITADCTFANAYGDTSPHISKYCEESFDNTNLFDAMSLSMVLAYKTSRQGPAMEMMYRTIITTPNQGMVDIEVPNLYVQNTVTHDTNGLPADFGFRRVLDSAIDPQVLADKSTTIVPTYNDDTADFFAPSSAITPYNYVDGRRTVVTSELVMNKRINLFSIGMLDTVSRVGTPDYTDALDRNIGLQTVTLALGTDLVRFNVLGRPYSHFVKGPEQNGRAMSLMFNRGMIILNEHTVHADATKTLQTPVFATIKNNKWAVRLEITVNGQIDVERGDISVYSGGNATVVSVTDTTTNTLIPLSDPGVQAVVTALAGFVPTYFWPDARVTNTNFRHLGLILNNRTVKERFVTRIRPPFTIPYPITEDRNNNRAIEDMGFAIANKINNDGVTTLINYHARMMETSGGSGFFGDLTAGDFELNSIPVEGIARWLVNTYIATVDVDLPSVTQSLDTESNVANGITAILNSMRSAAYDVLQKTNYVNACRLADGGEISKNFEFAIVTSPTVERFLSLAGDSRTLGAGLAFRIESDIDMRLKEVIYMGIVRSGDDIDPLSNGFMLQSPTLVNTVPSVTRDNAPRSEAVSQPVYQHYQTLPILIRFNVTGVTELLNSTLPFRVKATTTNSGPVTINGSITTTTAP